MQIWKKEVMDVSRRDFHEISRECFRACAAASSLKLKKLIFFSFYVWFKKKKNLIKWPIAGRHVAWGPLNSHDPGSRGRGGTSRSLSFMLILIFFFRKRVTPSPELLMRMLTYDVINLYSTTRAAEFSWQSSIHVQLSFFGGLIRNIPCLRNSWD